MTPVHQVTILVIEDDEPVRLTLVDTLELNGFRVVAATNGTEGLALAKRDLPSLIITDVNMPGMTGFELLETFRRDEALRAIPVIVISAKVDRAATRRGMELGAADFITKPFTEEEVLHSVAARLEKKELLDELDAFAHTVAHDLKNPLATLVGRIDLLGMLMDSADKAALRHHLDEAMKSSTRLSGIIDELLILSSVRRQTVASEQLDMAAIAAEAIDCLDSLIKRQNARLEVPTTWPASVGHPPWIMQVWVNYISNALKYGGEAPVIKLGSEPSADGKFVRFWVQDSGPGLDDDAKARLFVPFTRIRTIRASGYGLGLSIVRRIVEKLGGKVGVISTPGSGAKFWFELPSSLPRPTTHPFSKQ